MQSAPTRPPIPAPQRSGLGQRIERLLAAASWPIERAHGRALIDLRPLVMELAMCEGVLGMRLRMAAQGSAGPRDVLAALGLADLEQQGVRLRRTAVEICV